MRLIYVCCLFMVLISCGQKGNVDQQESIKEENISSKLKGQLFKEDSLNSEIQKSIIFKPILNSSTRSNADELLKKLGDQYNIKFENGLVLNKVYHSKIYGYSDSIWVMECIVPRDSLCKPHGRKQQFFFDSKGHLIHTDRAANIKWVNFKENNSPLLMTLNTDCNGVGFHHFYKFDQGELLDIFNVLLENTPPTYDADRSDGTDFQPQELELKLEDINDDKIKDICFRGMKQFYKNGIFIKTQAQEYVFFYQPGEDWFLLKTLKK